MNFSENVPITELELLNRLPNLSDQILQSRYLSQVQYTDLLLSMMTLIDDKTQAIRMVDLTWEVDPNLAARLAGAAQPQIQQETVGQVSKLISKCVIGKSSQINLLAITASKWAVSDLVELFEVEYWHTYHAVKLVYERGDIEIKTLVIDSLLETLRKSHKNLKRIIITILGDIGNDRAVPNLIRCLPDPDIWLRMPVAEALGKIGSIQAVDELLIALKESSGDKQYASRCAAKALGLIGSDRAVEPLIRSLCDSSDVVRWGAIEALSIIGTKEAIEAVIKFFSDIKTTNDREIGWLEKGFQHQQSYAHRGHLNQASKIDRERLNNVLLDALSSNDENLRSRVASVITGIGNRQISDSLVTILQAGSHHARSEAASILGKIGDEQEIDPLIAALQDRSYWVRQHAVSALGIIGDERTIEPLIITLQDPEYWVRHRAALALGKMGGEKSIEALTAALQSPHLNFRKVVTRALGLTGDDRAIEPLIIALYDPSNRVRMSAAGALGIIGGDRAIEPLISALQDRYHLVRRIAFQSLLSIPEVKVNYFLQISMQNQYQNIRNAIAELLPKINLQIAMVALSDALKHHNRYVHRDAARFLGLIIPKISNQEDLKIALNLVMKGHGRAIEPLIELLKHHNATIRINALDVLDKIVSEFGEILSPSQRNLIIKKLTKYTKDVDWKFREFAQVLLDKINAIL